VVVKTERMPVGFVGHGSPFNAVDDAKGAEWRAWAGSVPKPLAILVISAHWEAAPVTIGRTRRHDELFYDFYGFPEFMYALRYPAPGAPDVADRVEHLLSPHVRVAREESRPIDHGTWVPLLQMFPDADIPVLEISMPMLMTEDELYAMGRELSPLRDEGVFILGTGNLVHNLREISWEDVPPADYAVAFDRWVAGVLARRDHAALREWRNAAPEALHSHPSAEHYRPILVAAGASRDDGARFPVEGFEHRTIARRCVHLAP
jgi:4,5-DOPA dioxygenase extradiol